MIVVGLAALEALSVQGDMVMLAACRRAGRNLSVDEWRLLLPADEPYHKTCPNLP